jgi:hypothetical protein
LLKDFFSDGAVGGTEETVPLGLVPHSGQNLLSSGISLPHFEQNINSTPK